MSKQEIKGAPVCVVGGAGFLGSHLVDYLVEDRDCVVTVVDNLVSGRREFVHPKANFVHYDITQGKDYLGKLFCDLGTEWVFNYAAYPYIPDCYADPIRVMNVNLFGAMNVIQAADEMNVRGVLQVSSAEIYQSLSYSPMPGTPVSSLVAIDEHWPVNPVSSYGVSKAAVDNLVRVWSKENGVRAISLRQFNCLGARETHPYVVTEIMSQLFEQNGGRSRDNYVVRLGNNSFRDFMDAGVAAQTAVRLLEVGDYGESYNLGSGASLPVYDLAKVIGKELGLSVSVEHDPKRDRAIELWSLRSDNQKIEAALGGAIQTDPLGVSVKRVWDWYSFNNYKWPWE